jgi:hypothetical protein
MQIFLVSPLKRFLFCAFQLLFYRLQQFFQRLYDLLLSSFRDAKYPIAKPTMASKTEMDASTTPNANNNILTPPFIYFNNID